MASNEFIIRPAAPEDIKKVFELSNDDTVRANSINKDKIEWKSHVKWFNARIKRENEPFYTAETKEGAFIGQIRLDKKDDGYIISISLAKEFRGKGLAAKIIAAAAEKSGFKNITAEIYADNTASIKAFEKAGFKKNALKGELWVYTLQQKCLQTI